MSNRILYETEILKLDKNNYKEILNKKVKLNIKREDLGKTEFIGIIRKVNFETFLQHKVFDIVLEDENENKLISLGIIGINKIELK